MLSFNPQKKKKKNIRSALDTGADEVFPVTEELTIDARCVPRGKKKKKKRRRDRNTSGAPSFSCSHTPSPLLKIISDQVDSLAAPSGAKEGPHRHGERQVMSGNAPLCPLSSSRSGGKPGSATGRARLWTEESSWAES